MSQSPIHDTMQSACDLARSVGQMQGRESMKLEILEILRRSSKPSPNLVAMIRDIEQLDITENSHASNPQSA